MFFDLMIVGFFILIALVALALVLRSTALATAAVVLACAYYAIMPWLVLLFDY